MSGKTQKDVAVIKDKAKKIKAWLNKYKLWLAGIIFLIMLFPFILVFINKIIGLNIEKLKNFNIAWKDLLAPWVAIWAGSIAAYSVVQMQKRITMQEKQQSDTRFSSGVELLGHGHKHESTRIGGIYNLFFLANENSNEYLDTVCEILCVHIISIINENGYKKKYREKPSHEIQTILNLLFIKDKNGKLIFDNCSKNLRGTFLCGANFDGATLSNADFREAELSKVNFSRAELSKVNFSGAKLSDTCFSGAKLSSVDFLVAKLSSVDFRKATLCRAYFRGTTFSGTDFREAILIDAFFFGATLIDAYFSKAKLSSADFRGTTLIDADFRGATLSSADFFGAKLSNADFSNAKLEDGVSFYKTKLQNCNYKEITSPGCSLKSTKPDKNK